jgi:hypothetical protein
MNFALTPQMIDKIGFAMEDQKEQFAVDVDSGELVPLSTLGERHFDEGYARLPRWGSAEGFHLMESFVTSLDNPAYREQLSRALTMGRGVFRAFKDSLKANKEIERLWFAYKEQRLRAVIVSWYNANREARGLAKLPAEPEETEELVMSDFSFAWGVGEHGEEVLRRTGMPSSSCSRTSVPSGWKKDSPKKGGAFLRQEARAPRSSLQKRLPASLPAFPGASSTAPPCTSCSLPLPPVCAASASARRCSGSFSWRCGHGACGA